MPRLRNWVSPLSWIKVTRARRRRDEATEDGGREGERKRN